ncbi:hypothetical protein G6027_06295 [Dietzia sp. SLG310A2-38A2]|uniref:hypothetical protein n=1 Tax=Dietzia sp. SLG310A2-38A2 TaxID=1630643 RepID=UPI0015F85F06|nr:hypothetical protein [Dietzia sp. SLG310A2-38A2]MBB1030497.1 hypothetical protein [Dietzia sp. SLG310A2-38A2]
MNDQWWTEETEHTTGRGEVVSFRTRSTGVVWDEFRPRDEHGRRHYRAWVRISQQDGEDVPGISLWLHNGVTPPPVFTVDEALTLGHALLEAAELVDRERDAAIRAFLEDVT